ncbi:hypothetical protein OG604_22910 [Streptomyces sp. NBC_01231]|nr:hypothetical protein OG604_22910 [Streptomyces sp. NBC_01231]
MFHSKIKTAAVLGAVAAAGLLGTAAPASAAPASPADFGTDVCGSGYRVIDSHALAGDGSIVWLMYNSSNGKNCVATQLHYYGPQRVSASIQKQGGSPISDSGTYNTYAGPVYVSAPDTCIKWGGSANGSSWTSGWEHCG